MRRTSLWPFTFHDFCIFSSLNIQEAVSRCEPGNERMFPCWTDDQNQLDIQKYHSTTITVSQVTSIPVPTATATSPAKSTTISWRFCRRKALMTPWRGTWRTSSPEILWPLGSTLGMSRMERDFQQRTGRWRSIQFEPTKSEHHQGFL